MTIASETQVEQPLNIESLADLLSEILPLENGGDGTKGYTKLLEDLYELGIYTPRPLRRIVESHKTAILKEDKEWAELAVGGFKHHIYLGDMDRLYSGTYYTHVELVGLALNLQFGDKWREQLSTITAEKQAGQLLN